MRFKSAILFILLLSSIHVFAVKVKDITFKNKDFTLAGSIYIPKGEGPFPAVVFVHGSGPEERNNSSYSAKWLASIGYIVLTYDKRGTGESDGDKKSWSRFSFDDLSDDVVAAVNYLSNQPNVDKDKIGLHATSQGGWVASLALSKTNLIHYLIMKSTSMTTVELDRIYERAERLKGEGLTPNELKEAMEMQLVEARKSLSDSSDDFIRLFEKYKNSSWIKKVYPVDDPLNSSLVDYRNWYATIVDFDPIPYLKSTDTPIFWIFGDPKMDKLAPINQSIQNVYQLEKEGKKYAVFQYDGQGHNIKESAYEKDLYNWLDSINHQSDKGYNFKKH